ncbi:MAG: hypothetical protein IPM76_27255 [Chloroflexi bacterium]|nr:hypothetical protein [Chloroflexota bacterium]
MDAHHDGAARSVDAFNEVNLPQRFAHVQRRAGQVAEQVLQGGLVGGRRQGQIVDVGVDVEVGVFFPLQLAQRPPAFFQALAKAIKRQQAGGEGRFDGRSLQWLIKQQNANHKHEVGGVFHVHPDGVGGGEGFGFCGHTAVPFCRWEVGQLWLAGYLWPVF